MNKRRLNILRVLISAGALIFLFWKVVNPDETLGTLRQADVRYLLAALLLYVSSLIVRAYRWFLLLRGLELTVTFGRLVHLYFVGQFFSSFLPTQFGGDVMRALELTEDTESVAAVGTVLLDRMMGLLVLLLMGLVALPFLAAQMDPWLIWLLVVVSAAGLVGGGLVLEGRLLRLASGWLPASLSLAGQGPLAQIYTAVTGCGWKAVTGAFAVSVGFNLINILINWLCGQAVEVEAGLGYFFIVTPLLSVSGMIPSIGGWGVREAVSTAVFAPIGAGADVATALAILLGGIALAAGLLGGLIYGIDRLRGLRGLERTHGRHQDDHQFK